MGGIQNIKMVASTQNNNAQVDVRTLPNSETPEKRAILRDGENFAGVRGREIIEGGWLEDYLRRKGFGDDALDYIDSFSSNSVFGRFEWKVQYLFWKDMDIEKEFDNYIDDFDAWFEWKTHADLFAEEKEFIELLENIAYRKKEKMPCFYKNPIEIPDMSPEFEMRWVKKQISWGFKVLSAELRLEYGL